jgi:hypothetical protein
VNLLDHLDVVLVAPEGLHQDEVVPLRNDDRQPFEAQSTNRDQSIPEVVGSVRHRGKGDRNCQPR